MSCERFKTELARELCEELTYIVERAYEYGAVEGKRAEALKQLAVAVAEFVEYAPLGWEEPVEVFAKAREAYSKLARMLEYARFPWGK